MYLFCYARSKAAREVGNMLLSKAEGEWIDTLDDFLNGEASPRVDGAVVLILPPASSVKIITEKIYPAGTKYPIFCMASDGTNAMILKHSGYNTYELFAKMCDVAGCNALSSPIDKKELAADLMQPVEEYHMTPDNEELLKEISSYVSNGGNVTVYSDMQVRLSEPVLDSISYSTYLLRSNQHNEIKQAYKSACEADEYTIFITCTKLPDVPNKGKCLKLIPRHIAVGVEFTTGRVDPDYASETVQDVLTRHEIDPLAVSTIAVSTMAKESDAVMKIASDIGSYVTSYDLRLLNAVKVPLKPTYAPGRQTADLCTAAACLAADNNISTLIRRSGGNGVMISAIMKRGSIDLTK
ncbi:MAG: cobalamin biosynthesis protein [Saccharofermentans sp.]|nr:cobalamin biosynthesis protein [Saccharofermentans sp.]